MAKLAVKIGVTPQLIPLIVKLANVTRDLDLVDLVTITSGTDGKHKVKSKHYSAEAIDVRTKNFPSTKAKREFLALLQREFGRDYDIILEYLDKPNEHIHIEYDPKPAE
jgi:hypothetical protein